MHAESQYLIYNTELWEMTIKAFRKETGTKYAKYANKQQTGQGNRKSKGRHMQGKTEKAKDTERQEESQIPYR